MSCSSPYLARPAFWMACSIASSTSSRSMLFSRATMSATCSISRRGISAVVAMLSSWFPIPSVGLLRAFRGAAVFVQKRVGDLELGPRDLGQRHVGLLGVLEPQPNRAVLEAEQRAFEAPPALDRLHRLETGEMAGPAHVILLASERPVDPGRAHLQGVGAGDRVLDIQHRRQ